MVSLVDRNVGQILDLLKELDLDENTIVFLQAIMEARIGFAQKINREVFFLVPNVNPKNGVEFRGGKEIYMRVV